MKVLIVFASSHGTTEKAAHILRNFIEGDVDIVDLHENAHPDVRQYDVVIIGASIHIGSISGKERKFINRNLDLLVSKKIGLFVCCMKEGELAMQYFEHAFPQQLRDISVADGFFGGEFIFAKMNFIEKQFVRRVSGVTEDVSNLHIDSIAKFANQFNNILTVC